jgi:magnesium-dependent phosphatase-1
VAQKLFLFDCDETLWTSIGRDYVSSHNSRFSRVDKDSVVRGDGVQFMLRSGVREAFSVINSREHIIGVVSDNLPEPVFEVLELLELDVHVSQDATLVTLWEGYCPKDAMVTDILGNLARKGVTPNETYWFDDKDYTDKAANIGVNFTLITDNADILALTSSKLD